MNVTKVGHKTQFECTDYQAILPYLLRQRLQLLQACNDVFNVTGATKCMDRLAAAPAGTASQLGTSLEEHQVLEFTQVFGCKVMEIPGWQARFDMRVPTCADYVRSLFPTELQTDRIEKLYKYGLDFLYGMVFRHAFQMTEALAESIGTTNAFVDPDAFSVAVHTRHPSMQQDGSSVERETACMDRVLSSRPQNNKTCQVYIMSDREKSNQMLAKHAQKRGCQGITVAHTSFQDPNTTVYKQRHGQRQEHGPFAGAGYWKDMALALQARNGWVATTRSSSGLIHNLLVYDRIMERLLSTNSTLPTNEASNMTNLHGLDICIHNGKDWTG